MVRAPARGEVVWLNFDPQTGRETTKTRPALVLSPAAYNAKTHLCLVCPITSQVKGYPFEVALPPGFPIAGVVLADQAKSLDWVARQATFAATVPPEVLGEVTRKLVLLVEG